MANLNAPDIKFYKSVFSASGIGSLGGAIDTGNEVTSFAMHNLFDKTTQTQATSGIVKFRCLYIKNIHTVDPIRNPILTIPQNTISANDEMSIGWDPAGLTSNAQTIADQHTYPTNVTFMAAPDRANGAVLGQNIPPGKTKPFWLRLVSRFGAEPMLSNAMVVRLLAENLVTEVIEQAPVPPPSASFTVFGETNLNSTLSTIVEEVEHRNSNLNISVGNNTLSNTSTNPQDWFNIIGDEIARITRLALGANDMTSTSQIQSYLNKYGITEKFSSTTMQNIHFLFMDTASGPDAYSTSSPQYEFVVNDLKSASADSTIDWIFVIMNRAMYASQTSTTTKYVLKSLRDIYHPLFEQYGVHCVINGYFNNYQRQHVLHFNAANSDNPTSILSGQAPNYVIVKGNASFDDGSGNSGCLFLNVGCGGAAHDNVSSQNSHTVTYDSAHFGYLHCMLNNVRTFSIEGDPTSDLLEDYREIVISFFDEVDDILRDYCTLRKMVTQNVRVESRHKYRIYNEPEPV